MISTRSTKHTCSFACRHFESVHDALFQIWLFGLEPTLSPEPLRPLATLPHASPLAAILHADDPILLGCCRGEIQRSLFIVAVWGHRHGAALHAGTGKTVFMICGHQATPPETQHCLPGRGSEADSALHTEEERRWLWVTWTTSLSLQQSLFHKAALASAVWGPICRLLRSSALPMDLAANLFRTKVLPVLLQGACMHGLEDNLSEFLSQLQNSLAQQVFDLDTWLDAPTAL